MMRGTEHLSLAEDVIDGAASHDLKERPGRDEGDRGGPPGGGTPSGVLTCRASE